MGVFFSVRGYIPGERTLWVAGCDQGRLWIFENWQILLIGTRAFFAPGCEGDNYCERMFRLVFFWSLLMGIGVILQIVI